MAEPARRLDDEEPIYDESGTAPSSPKPDLKALEGGSETTEPRRGHLSTAGDQPSRNDLSEAENGSFTSGPRHENQVGTGYQRRPSDQSFLSKLTDRKRKLLIGSSLGAVLISLVIAVFGGFLATLKLPHLENHLSRRLTRSARTFTERINALQTDKVLADASTDAEVQSLLSKNPLGKALNVYKPNLAVKAMQANGSLSFEYDAKGKISSVIIDGQHVEAPDLKFGRIFQNRAKWKTFYQDLYKATDTALLRDGQSYLVRTRVSKAVVQAFGGKLYFWQRKGADEAGKTEAQALEDTQLQLFEDVQGSPTEGQALTDNARKTADAAVQDEKTCLSTPLCSQEVSSGQLSLLDASGASKRVSAYADSIKNLAENPIISNLSTLYAVGAPVCMIYDGSIETSKAIIDAQQSSALRAYLALAAAGDQQKPGDVTAAAVGGLNDALGDISDTNPERLARNEPIDTSTEPYAQTTRTQNYTIFNTTFGALAPAANTFANTFCPILLNQDLLFGVLGISAATLLLPGVGKIIENSLERFSTEGLRVVAQQAIKNVFDRALLRFTDPIQRKVLLNSGLKFGVTNGATVAGTDAISYAARMVVLAEMGAFADGGDLKNLVNQADMGGVVYNSEMDRQQNFGRPMTSQETSQTNVVDTGYLASQNKNMSVFSRYLSLSNPNSALADELVGLSGVISKPSKIVSAIISFPSAFMSSVKLLFSSTFTHAAAASSTDTQDYNVAQWGWTNDENNLINSDPSFDPLVNAQTLQDSGQSRAILDKYGVCFGVKDDGSGNPISDPSATMGELISSSDGGAGYLQLDSNGNINPTQGLCSPTDLSYNNSEFGPKMVFRWRLNQSYMNAMNELSDMQSAGGGVAQ